MNQVDDGKFEEGKDQDPSANLDPRIGIRLEDLNKWTGKINALEKSFEEANSNFRLILSESTDRLKSLASKLGKCVEESRPYYDAKERLIEVQGRCQRAAINYDKACQAYLEAKERIKLAEKKFSSASNEFDTTWQEMLNQANIKLMEAEAMKKESERLHHQSMKDFHCAEVVVFNLEKKLKGALQRSRIYFDEKRRFQERLALVKEEIELTISQINCSKARYAATLRELEAISEEIHEQRNCSLLKRLRREPGVGAEFKPVMITLDSCEMMMAKLDLRIDETLNCHQTESIESSDVDSLSQASTSDAIIYQKEPRSESESCDKSDDDEKADENTMQDNGVYNGQGRNISPVSDTSSSERKRINKIKISNADDDSPNHPVEEDEKDNGETSDEDDYLEDENSEEEDSEDEYEDVDEVKISNSI